MLCHVSAMRWQSTVFQFLIVFVGRTGKVKRLGGWRGGVVFDVDLHREPCALDLVSPLFLGRGWWRIEALICHMHV